MRGCFVNECVAVMQVLSSREEGVRGEVNAALHACMHLKSAYIASDSQLGLVRRIRCDKVFNGTVRAFRYITGYGLASRASIEAAGWA